MTAPGYQPEEAKKLLAEAGWSDSDKDGYVDKEGENLTIRWVTYPSRQELPLLAETVQATLKEVGIKVEVNCSADFQSFLDSGDWDIYAGAFVCAPTGDPEYFFTTHCLDESSKNRGGYHSDKLQELENQMKATFDTDERAKLATEMTQTILDDNAFIFASHLRMSIVSGKGVTGLEAHPCDYYEITVDLDKRIRKDGKCGTAYFSIGASADMLCGTACFGRCKHDSGTRPDPWDRRGERQRKKYIDQSGHGTVGQ